MAGKHAHAAIRFWRFVKRGAPEACWEWQGSINAGGYGRLSVDGRAVTASRLSFELHWRPLRKGEHACHRCDNRACVNPWHLYNGSRSENMQDMHDRGRHNTHGKLRFRHGARLLFGPAAAIPAAYQ